MIDVVSDVSGDHMVESHSSMGLVMALFHFVSLRCRGSSLSICIVLHFLLCYEDTFCM